MFKKLASILVLAFLLILWGCNESSPIEKVVELTPWEQFQVNLDHYLEVIPTFAPTYESNTLPVVEATQYKTAFMTGYQQVNSSYQVSSSDLTPFTNYLNAFKTYITDGTVTGFEQVFEIDPTLFQALGVVIVYTSDSDIYIHIMKEGLSIFTPTMDYITYHYGLDNGNVLIESIKTSISATSNPNYNYYKIVENDGFTRVSHSSSGDFFDYYSFNSPRLFRTQLDSNGAMQYVQWYDEIKGIKYYKNMSEYSQNSLSFELYNDYGTTFSFERFSDNSISMFYELLAIDGWDKIVDTKINTYDSSTQAVLYNQNQTLLLGLNEKSILTLQSDTHSMVWMRINYDAGTKFTDGMVTLSDYGLDINNDNLTAFYVNVQITYIEQNAYKMTSFHGYDFTVDNFAKSFLESFDEFFVIDELKDIFYVA